MSQALRTWLPLGTASTSIPAGAFVSGIRSAYPNPLNPHVTIGFTCRRADQAQLAIHDVAGRRVALLVAGQLEGGEHEVMWDGRDHSGRLVPTGQYVARLVTDDGESVRKLMLVR